MPITRKGAVAPKAAAAAKATSKKEVAKTSKRMSSFDELDSQEENQDFYTFNINDDVLKVKKFSKNTGYSVRAYNSSGEEFVVHFFKSNLEKVIEQVDDDGNYQTLPGVTILTEDDTSYLVPPRENNKINWD